MYRRRLSQKVLDQFTDIKQRQKAQEIQTQQQAQQVSREPVVEANSPRDEITSNS